MITRCFLQSKTCMRDSCARYSQHLPHHCQAWTHNLFCTIPTDKHPPYSPNCRCHLKMFSSIEQRNSSLRGWEPLNHGHHHVKVDGSSPIQTVKCYSSNKISPAHSRRRHIFQPTLCDNKCSNVLTTASCLLWVLAETFPCK